jgi:hypothetical protein
MPVRDSPKYVGRPSRSCSRTSVRSSIWHLLRLLFPPWCPAKALPTTSRVGDLQPHLLAEHRQSSTGGFTLRGDKIVSSEQPLVLACCLPGLNCKRSMLCDPRCCVSTENGRASHHLVVLSRPGRRSGSVPPRSGDSGVRRARVGTVSSVSTVAAFGLDSLLARSRRHTTATAT